MFFRLILVCIVCLLPIMSVAAETRGLRVVVKDPTSGQQSEVKPVRTIRPPMASGAEGLLHEQ